MVESLKSRPGALTFGIGNVTHRIAVGVVLQSAQIDIKPVKWVVLLSLVIPAQAGMTVERYRLEWP